jgi:microcystin-dependent protein
MSSPYVGEIRIFAGNFAPAGWAFCNGATIPISENDTLFTLIGTTYGGDGQETFNLPDLQGRAPMHVGNSHVQGEQGGVETVTLSVQQIPSHTHAPLASMDPAAQKQVTSKVMGRAPAEAYASEFTGAALNTQSISVVGGSQPHENMQPYLAMNYIISLFGIFPHQ